ncbi:cupredoxin domain-containing protein [Anaeromyxobacter oryzae]|uniref:EfeO-type cupredoxin-like domain-containing protein n=1 Tax=Anaeromyxobacter oryzae TaxID=2918170 RepID=A0ABM7WPJ9_9BACT|nr:cupredoxin family copper-binding protein [Anaeromyxobacter oryzae]BDG01387.1 hypothetical protein AMOR_03830 [Anaeromyxobacter oryzae]
MIPTRTASRIRTLAVAACAGLLIAAAGDAGPGQASPREVRISAHRYLPQTVTVPRGATVRWVNEDDDPHTVTSDGGAFASRGIDTSETYTFTFDAPGSFPYHCALHPTMTGTVVVQ